MFKSIKSKLILLFVTLLMVTLTVVGLLVNSQVEKQIYDGVTSQSKGLAAEMRNSIQLYTERYSTDIQQMSLSKQVKDYLHDVIDSKEGNESIKDLESEFTNYIGINENISSIYAASVNKQLKIIPDADLPADFDPTSRDWYIDAAANPDEVIWTEPYEDPATKEYIVTASYAVKEGSEIIGVLGLDIQLAELTAMIGNVDTGYDGYPFIFSKEGVAIVHPEYRNENLMEYPFIQAMYDSEQDSGVSEYEFEGDEKLLVYETVRGTSWKVGMAYSNAKLLESAVKMQFVITVISLIALFISATLVYFIANQLTKPLITLKQGVNQFAEGNLNVHTNFTSKDEIGELGRHFNLMVDQMKSVLTTVNDSVKNMKESAESLSAVSEETNASSEEMAAAVNEIATGATKSAEEAESSNLLSVQLSNRINDISKQTTSMTHLAVRADDINHAGIEQVAHLKDSFDTSKGFMKSTEEVINNLEDKVKKIEKVMTTITDISTQTNLLALNASIEAARAGEHGKGFAVVAEEVRKLAEQSVMATDEVKSTITDIQEGASSAVDSMEKTKKNFEQQTAVVNHTEVTFNSISELVEQMKESILYINGEVDKIAKDKEEVIQSIQSMAVMSEQAAASCEEVSASTDEQVHAIQSVAGSAEHLTDLSNELTQVVNKFKF
ncbi:methyl-accepting chemotaxis protein [Cytobacillus purgationiresistens]|uniref:Methyl-accepting chemotaxis protein n=1 Tax=Cytobacillus purgationiresistens TaxID=863449 RepID=A0ABU0AL07_9BACI|nr:methyl-accepting chemotaxis protein [Cytobacillus purgationiresistens]MDQ0271949.1 methyl-accepting chemotaxis protein [Cytobacillus purgationiresistens]